MTAVAIIEPNGKETTFVEETTVVFHRLSQELIEAYVDSGDPFDKAGGYGIQTIGTLLVKRIEGDYNNVVGLPLAALFSQLVDLQIVQFAKVNILLEDALPTLMIRDVNIEDRPRERLLRQGAESLSNQELLAILLRTGTKEESVLVLANRVLNVLNDSII